MVDHNNKEKNHELYPSVDLAEQLAPIRTCLQCVDDAEQGTPLRAGACVWTREHQLPHLPGFSELNRGC